MVVVSLPFVTAKRIITVHALNIMHISGLSSSCSDSNGKYPNVLFVMIKLTISRLSN